MRQVTLSVITSNDEILLGMKKRGFGKDKWNGFGGKPNQDESLLDCIIRETNEEAGITLLNPKLVGIIDFFFINKPSDWNQQVHIYKTSNYKGIPKETEEMLPKKFLMSEIPYDEMWVDDQFWLPLVLSGKKIKGSFTFNEDGSINKKEINEVSEL